LAIAAAAPDEVRRLSAAVDAQRGDVVAGLFRRESDGWCVHVGPARLVPADTWLRELPAEVPVTGPILRKFSERLPPGVRALDAAFWAPRAGNVARVAAHLHAAGRRDDLWTLVPLYSRRPAAEEKWEEKQRKAGDVKRFR
jgi:tRNA A37 threonylcarbamoyladenosine modification protein TsaB